jgi:hypothetical protein
MSFWDIRFLHWLYWKHFGKVCFDCIKQTDRKLLRNSWIGLPPQSSRIVVLIVYTPNFSHMILTFLTWNRSRRNPTRNLDKNNRFRHWFQLTRLSCFLLPDGKYSIKFDLKMSRYFQMRSWFSEVSWWSTVELCVRNIWDANLSTGLRFCFRTEKYLFRFRFQRFQ